MSSSNKIGKALIDVTKESKVAISKRKLQFSDNEDTKATAMVFIKDVDSDDDNKVEGYIAIGTSDFSVILLKVYKGGQAELIFVLHEAH